MVDFLINMAVIGALVFVMTIVICVCRKWLTRSQMLSVYIIIPVLALVLLSSCDSAGDHTGENWLMLIGLLLCWLKG